MTLAELITQLQEVAKTSVDPNKQVQLTLGWKLAPATLLGMRCMMENNESFILHLITNNK